MKLSLSIIRTDGGTQPRAELDPATVKEYAERLADKERPARFPDVVVYNDGTHHWLAGGFHRHEAHVRVGKKTIHADVRQGTLRDAILCSVGENADHGLPRTNADKRRAVERLLRDEEWRQWSNREIARRCAVSDGMVGDLREELYPGQRQVEVLTGDGRTVATGSEKKSAGALGNQNARKPTGERRVTREIVDEAPGDEGVVVAVEEASDVVVEEAAPAARGGARCDRCGKAIALHQVHCPRCDEHVSAARASCQLCGGDLRDVPVSRPVATVAPAPALPVVRDGLGLVLPKEAAAIAGFVNPRLDSIADLLAEAARLTEHFERDTAIEQAAGRLPKGPILHPLAGHLDAKDLHAKAHAVRGGTLHTVCPYCNGGSTSCSACRGAGWATEAGYERAPAELRGVRAAAGGGPG